MFLYEIFGDFSTVVASDEDFVLKLRQSAHFLPGSGDMSSRDYMDGYAKRAWHLGHVIRSYDEEAFVFDLVRSGLLKKSRVN